jgi:hypothetical protein
MAELEADAIDGAHAALGRAAQRAQDAAWHSEALL